MNQKTGSTSQSQCSCWYNSVCLQYCFFQSLTWSNLLFVHDCFFNWNFVGNSSPSIHHWSNLSCRVYITEVPACTSSFWLVLLDCGYHVFFQRTSLGQTKFHKILVPLLMLTVIVSLLLGSDWELAISHSCSITPNKNLMLWVDWVLSL